MKIRNIILLLILPMLIIAQEHTEEITMSYTLSGASSQQTLVVENVSGMVEIKGYDGAKIKVSVQKTIEGESNKYLQEGIREVQYADYQDDDHLYIYTSVPNLKLDKEIGKFNYSWNHDGWRTGPRYDYQMDYVIEIPHDMNIDINVINNGNAIVKNVQAEHLKVNVINGGIEMTDVAGQTNVNALNDDISISYSENPTKESWYNSLNGDISIYFPSDIDADVSHKSLNGDIYVEQLPTPKTSEIVRTKSGKGKRVKYRIKATNKFQLGNGGVELHFDQLNGDTFIKTK